MLRVTGGQLRGQKVSSPSSSGIVRPTSSKTKQALFNILGSVENLSFCDVFAGTGLVGIEALSRGASQVTFIENNVKVYKQLQNNLKKFSFFSTQYDLIKANARNNVADIVKKRYDIVFSDPPFHQDFETLLQDMENLVKNKGICVLQYPSKQEPKWLCRSSQIKMYGDSSLAFIPF